VTVSSRRVSGAIFGAIAACLTAVPWADDWPAWTGPRGCNIASEKGLPAEFDRSEMKNVRWVTRLGSVAFGCPTVSNGRIFVGTNYPAVKDDPRFADADAGVLACLDEDTGHVLWRLVSPERKDGFPPRTHMVQQRWGICSSPTVDGDRVYVVTNGDDVLCLDVLGLKNGNDGRFQDEARYIALPGAPPVELRDSDADIVWRYDIPRELEVAPHDVGSCSVLIHGDALYTSTSNGIGQGSPVYALNQSAPAFIALDKRTGRLLAVEDEHISERLWHAQWSSPSKGDVGGRTLVFLGGGDGVCYAFEALSEGGPEKPHVAQGADAKPLDAVGRLKTVWRYDCNPHHYKFRDGKRIYYYQGDVRVYRTKRRNRVSTDGFNSGDGSFVGPSQIIATPVFHENRVYIATGRDPIHGLGRGVLHCIDATQTGDITESGRVWSYEHIGRTMATVAVSDGLVYAADLAGRLHCLDAADGQLYWIHDSEEETWGNPLVADGKVYLNTKESFWILAAAREKRIHFVSRGGSECAPIAANGVVYVFIKGRLYALEAKR
jgi:outer membrane protein assembly factor BamB